MSRTISYEERSQKRVAETNSPTQMRVRVRTVALPTEHGGFRELVYGAIIVLAVAVGHLLLW